MPKGVFHRKVVLPHVRFWKKVKVGLPNECWLFEAGIEYFDHVRPHRTPETYFQRNVMRVEATKAALVGTVREIAAEFSLAL